MPPGVITPQFSRGGVAVSVELGAHVSRWGLREGIVAQQAQRRRIVLQEPQDKWSKPGVGVLRRDGRKPHQPIQPQVIRRPLRRGSAHRSGFAFEFVFLPHRLIGDLRLVGAFDHYLPTGSADGAERAVRVDQVEGIERHVHPLPAGDHVAHRPVGQHRGHYREDDHQAGEPRRSRGQRRLLGNGQYRRGRRRVNRAAAQQDRQPVQPGEVTRDHQPQLGDDDDRAGDAGHRLRGEQSERDDELREMVADDFHPMQGLGEVMEEPAQRPRHRLSLVVVVQAGQIAPARVTTELDQSRTELEPEQQQARQPHRQHRWRHPVIAEEDGQETGLQQ